MPATSHRRARRSLTDLRRSEILVAATDVFGKKSFAATRMEDIAAAAGIAKGTLYLYFRSKEEIYAGAIGAAIESMQSLAAARVAAVTGVRERLAAAIAVRVEFWVEQPALYRLILTVGREARHRRQTNAILRSGQQSLLELLREGADGGDLARLDLEAIAWSILDMIRGCNERRLDRITTTTPQQDAESITRLALQALQLA